MCTFTNRENQQRHSYLKVSLSSKAFKALSTARSSAHQSHQTHENMIHACSNYSQDSWSAFKFIIKSHLEQTGGSQSRGGGEGGGVKRQAAPVCVWHDREIKGSPKNDAAGASLKAGEKRAVNKATGPAELCQWLRGGGCDSRAQVNHAHTQTLCALDLSQTHTFAAGHNCECIVGTQSLKLSQKMYWSCSCSGHIKNFFFNSTIIFLFFFCLFVHTIYRVNIKQHTH